MRRLQLVLATLGIVGLAACGPPVTATIGERVPDYAAFTMEGEQISLADLRGEVVLLNLWATWCWPCRREMPSLEALHREMEEYGVRVVAVSIDAAGDRGEIEEFVEELGLTFTILHDPEQLISRSFLPAGIPETYLIGPDGVLLKRWIGRIDGHSEAVRGPVREALGAARLAAR
jgi:cytochrome c biogenesis protein CcmG, thiol:disulfide interchange protein DsbE